jgi:hypothetical protein
MTVMGPSVTGTSVCWAHVSPTVAEAVHALVSRPPAYDGSTTIEPNPEPLADTARTAVGPFSTVARTANVAALVGA